jgi:hypothetical protein
MLLEYKLDGTPNKYQEKSKNASGSGSGSTFQWKINESGDNKRNVNGHFGGNRNSNINGNSNGNGSFGGNFGGGEDTYRNSMSLNTTTTSSRQDPNSILAKFRTRHKPNGKCVIDL